MQWEDFKNLIINNLSDDLLSKQYVQLRQSNPELPNCFGHCYVASEAAYYLLGGREDGWQPCYVKHLGASHWYLKHTSGGILDLTSEQFQSPVAYERGGGKGFLTQKPSKRAKLLLQRIANSSDWLNLKMGGGVDFNFSEIILTEIAHREGKLNSKFDNLNNIR